MGKGGSGWYPVYMSINRVLTGHGWLTAGRALGLFLVLGVSGGELRAEAPAAPTGAQAVSPGSGTSSTVKIFDDSVFNLQSAQPAGGTGGGIRTTPKGNTVYSADEPNYNQEQRNRWMKSCESLQDNRQAYRDCFESEKKSDLGRKGDSLPGTARGGSSTGTGASKPTPMERVSDPYDSIPQGSQDDDSDE
jgi:hypothetical protein